MKMPFTGLSGVGYHDGTIKMRIRLGRTSRQPAEAGYAGQEGRYHTGVVGEIASAGDEHSRERQPRIAAEDVESGGHGDQVGKRGGDCCTDDALPDDKANIERHADGKLRPGQQGEKT